MLNALRSQRVRPLLLLSLVGWSLFAAFRAGLLIASRDVLVNVGATEIARCFLMGLRYDSIPIGYAMLPLAVALTIAPSWAFVRPWFRSTIVAYSVAVTTIAIVAEVVGTAFFLHFGARLNSISMESRMLSYYACARELYLSRSYRAPETPERLAAHPEKD